MSVSRFAQLAGIPERTYWRRLARHRAGDLPKGPWPSPKADAIEASAAKYAADGPAWGHRTWARLRKRAFRNPPRQRNRVWQMDFSEFETARGGIWRICAVIDYATKYSLAATVTPPLAARTR